MMQHTVNSLVGFTVGAIDDEIGKVEEFYFDHETWTIRYLVVKTGRWLSGRKVLISPTALKMPDWKNKVFPVNLSKGQIQNSPDVDTEQTISRQQEIELYEHYTWQHYGSRGAGFYGGAGVSEQHTNQQSSDPHLLSTDDVTGYEIHATDGNIGTVEDFIVDERTWSLSFLIVYIGNWFPGKKIILSPKRITEMKLHDSSLEIDLSTNAIKDSLGI
ncbi:PRC-barrel domain-containing protein [Pedobacter hartonius]|uniref:PRC-barrel domain-containing protein n=1 Tax=Pedobacter hartonius TaxID=425514 RepID=A0A1H3W0Y5_9SPHI|nr:PRC-barrel domain-containing protein [Pedobacter hartonius]SDZ80767.1 PRC-barrel domain-containing protein [Pedobacter hartonius]